MPWHAADLHAINSPCVVSLVRGYSYQEVFQAQAQAQVWADQQRVQAQAHVHVQRAADEAARAQIAAQEAAAVRACEEAARKEQNAARQRAAEQQAARQQADEAAARKRKLEAQQRTEAAEAARGAEAAAEQLTIQNKTTKALQADIAATKEQMKIMAAELKRCTFQQSDFNSVFKREILELQEELQALKAEARKDKLEARQHAEAADKQLAKQQAETKALSANIDAMKEQMKLMAAKLWADSNSNSDKGAGARHNNRSDGSITLKEGKASTRNVDRSEPSKLQKPVSADKPAQKPGTLLRTSSLDTIEHTYVRCAAVSVVLALSECSAW